MSLRPPAVLLALALAGAGCATTGRVAVPATRELTATETVVTEAERQAATAANPQSTLHLQLAQDQLRMARQRLARGDTEQADLLLARARADAELAAAWAQLTRAQTTGRP